MDNKKSQEILRLISTKEIDYQRAVAQSLNLVTEDERKWMRQVLNDYDQSKIEISPSYFYEKKTKVQRNAIKETVRKELDKQINKLPKFTPQKLLILKDKNEKVSLNNFSGIYIIHNCVKDIYYVGQAKRVFDRAYNHFVMNRGNPEIYKDYSSSDEFWICLIPLEHTSFSSLNELEDNAIRAFDSFENGYNRMPGNILDKPIFRSDDYQQAAKIILDKIKETEIFSTLSNQKKRIKYTRTLFSELVLPNNISFLLDFAKSIKAYQKVN